jgi:hypothetical protein
MPTTIDPKIESLQLRPIARDAAYALKESHPGVIFTSGRRDKASQCRAMAQNVAQDRDYIRTTYAANKASRGCQQWVDDHPTATRVEQIAAGLLSVMTALTDAEIGQLSRHLSGDAFDVQPVIPDSDGIMETIRDLPGLRQFLEKEGHLIRWHAEFNA